MKAFITGISGHIGPHLARLLLEAGYEVGGLVRPSSNLTLLGGLPLQLHSGDILDFESLKKGMKEATVVFHLAAPTLVRTLKDKEAILKGIDNLIHGAKQVSSIEKIVYVSSTVTVGVTSNRKQPLNETDSMCLTGTSYQTAKWEAENWLMKKMKEEELPVVIVNPSTIIGGGDLRPTPPNKLVVDFLNHAGKWEWLTKLKFKEAPIWFQTGFSVAGVRDIAKGIFLASQKGQNGERYILSGDNITFIELYRALADITKLRAPYIYFPKPVMVAASWFLDRLMEHPPMSYRLAKTMVGRYAWFSCEKAREKLGYKSQPYQASLQEAVDWFIDTPLVEAKRKQRIFLS